MGDLLGFVWPSSLIRSQWIRGTVYYVVIPHQAWLCRFRPRNNVPFSSSTTLIGSDPAISLFALFRPLHRSCPNRRGRKGRRTREEQVVYRGNRRTPEPLPPAETEDLTSSPTDWDAALVLLLPIDRFPCYLRPPFLFEVAFLFDATPSSLQIAGRFPWRMESGAVASWRWDCSCGFQIVFAHTILVRLLSFQLFLFYVGVSAFWFVIENFDVACVVIQAEISLSMVPFLFSIYIVRSLEKALPKQIVYRHVVTAIYILFF